MKTQQFSTYLSNLGMGAQERMIIIKKLAPYTDEQMPTGTEIAMEFPHRQGQSVYNMIQDLKRDVFKQALLTKIKRCREFTTQELWMIAQGYGLDDFVRVVEEVRRLSRRSAND